jgi:hypothetical protein
MYSRRVSPHPQIKRSARQVCFSLMVVAAFVLAAAAANAQPQWYTLDGSPAGTPADVILDPASSATQSFFDIYIHGFYAETFVGPEGGTYTRVTVPGLPATVGVVGGPDLPVSSLSLAVPIGIGDVSFQSVIRENPSVFPNFLIAPKYQPGVEDTADAWVKDENIYSSPDPWPAGEGYDTELVTSKLGAILGEDVTVFAMRTNCVASELTVWSHLRVELGHAGVPTTSEPLTKDCVRLAAEQFANWPSVGSSYPPNVILYNADYLIVTAPSNAGALAPFVKQKSSRGFLVLTAYISPTGTSCSTIQSTISTWYYSTPSWHDHYVLLVGDVATIPLCNYTGYQTDDPYGSVNGYDLDEEVWVGRLSVDDSLDCSRQIAKILAYEDSAVTNGNYAEVLLAAHKEGSPGKYEGCQDSVAAASYRVAPNFTKLYGSWSWVRDSSVTREVDQQLGLVAYRGHGSATEWWQWNSATMLPESYDTTDVKGLANAPLAPVVWSYSCYNNALSVEDCLGEVWMEQAGREGAVAHYGSTMASNTNQNHELDRQMFKAVYDKGLTIHSHAIQYAEKQMATNVGSKNAWMYLLLGDPHMKIRRGPPPPWRVEFPQSVVICSTPPCSLSFEVYEEDDLDPVPGVLVAAYKSALGPLTLGPTNGDEVFVNRYTDGVGSAVLEASPTSTGWIYFTIQDDVGNAVVDSIEVREQGDVPPGGAERLVFRALPSMTTGATLFSLGRALGSAMTISIHDVSGRTVRSLSVDAGRRSVRWDGRTSSGARVASGLYFARLSGPEVTAVTRVVVVK